MIIEVGKFAGLPTWEVTSSLCASVLKVEEGHLPLYLQLIIFSCVMNTIMLIINFINTMFYVCQIAFIQYFTFCTFASLNFGCTHSNLACTVMTSMFSILRIIFLFRLPRRWSVGGIVAEVSSSGIFFIHS